MLRRGESVFHWSSGSGLVRFTGRFGARQTAPERSDLLHRRGTDSDRFGRKRAASSRHFRRVCQNGCVRCGCGAGVYKKVELAFSDDSRTSRSFSSSEDSDYDVLYVASCAVCVVSRRWPPFGSPRRSNRCDVGCIGRYGV